MGHIRLGRLPRTRDWRSVMLVLSDANAGVGEVGKATLTAARKLIGDPSAGQKGILLDDPGLAASFYVLAQTVSAAQHSDFLERLGATGIDVPEEAGASALAFVVRVSETVRQQVGSSPGGTPFSEIALLSLREVLSEALTSRPAGLFGATTEDVRLACKRYASTRRFGALSRRFFGTFLYRTLSFFISKGAYDVVGRSDRFERLPEFERFDQALRAWCHERAAIVESFAGGWRSKEAYVTGITPSGVKRFLAIALRKLGDEVFSPRFGEEAT